ncbi:MAG: hypothetical protein P1Q69_16090 [Candidatus Thorarchaeota archaeon]|nr:hypothetical protein [Candidatus Thorarchaeota archaeon]
MSEETDRPRILRAIKKCLSDSYDHFQQAMDELDEIGKGSVGPGMAPIVGGYAMPNPKNKYRSALIELDSAEKALKPLVKRFKDDRVNKTHFKNDDAIRLLGDLAGFEFNILIAKLSEQTGRESVWYRLREICENVEKIFKSVAEE